MPEEARSLAPAYYATRAPGWRRDVWAILHPPYTAWHLSYVLIGASLAPTLDLKRLAAVLFVFAYNLALLGGRLHGDFWFALSWGAFPVLTAYFAQTGRLSAAAVAVAAAAYALSFGQRALSTPARLLRRKTKSVTGTLTLIDGSETNLDEPALLRPLEVGLKAFAWGVVALAVGLAAAHFL